MEAEMMPGRAADVLASGRPRAVAGGDEAAASPAGLPRTRPVLVGRRGPIAPARGEPPAGAPRPSSGRVLVSRGDAVPSGVGAVLRRDRVPLSPGAPVLPRVGALLGHGDDLVVRDRAMVGGGRALVVGDRAMVGGDRALVVVPSAPPVTDTAAMRGVELGVRRGEVGVRGVGRGAGGRGSTGKYAGGSGEVGRCVRGRGRCGQATCGPPVPLTCPARRASRGRAGWA